MCGTDDKWANDNGDSYDHPIAQSLPIPIGPLSHHGQTFGGTQYQTKTSLSDRPGVLVPQLRANTSSSLRRASYAERDRVRPIDPGALDFTHDDDDDDEEEINSDPETGGKARQRALKILKARNEMPAAGKHPDRGPFPSKTLTKNFRHVEKFGVTRHAQHDDTISILVLL